MSKKDEQGLNDPENKTMEPGMFPGASETPPGVYPEEDPFVMPPAMESFDAFMQPGMHPGAPPMIPGMEPSLVSPPGMVAAPEIATGSDNPMLAMMELVKKAMDSGVPSEGIDPSALPFGDKEKEENDKGLAAACIRPALLTKRIKTQEAVPQGNVLDLLCLTEDRRRALGGIPKGCTMAFAGPPGKGKTRSVLAGLVKVALSGQKAALVVAEEGFYDPISSGRDDLCSRLVKIGMEVTGLFEDEFEKKVLENIWVLESQYHKGQTWDDFVKKYRYLIEKEQISFVVIDSLNMLDPSRSRTSDNLSALKTYNHEKGVTCLCVGQIRDSGSPVGGEALQHTADAVFLVEEISLSTKDMANMWGGKYRERIDIIRAIKSVTTPVFPHPVRVALDEFTGILTVHGLHPDKYAVLPI